MPHNALTTAIFAASYLGIALGGIPGLTIDRTGIAILGAILMMVTGALPFDEAIRSIDFPTILLLYALMILSAQFRLAGAYTRIVLALEPLSRRPLALLAVLIAVSAALSALLANDIVCLAFTPVLCAVLARGGLNPVPYLLALACASNVGSAATIIGNPQNMLLGQRGNLHFGAFFLACGPPAALGLGAVFTVTAFLFKGRMHTTPTDPGIGDWPAFNAWQATKGALATLGAVLLFFAPVPRELSALAMAGIVLCSRRMSTPAMLALVDWHLVSLFCGLFIVVHAVEQTGLPARQVAWLATQGYDIANPLVLMPASVLLSNLFSNVPAVMLLIPHLPSGGGAAWHALALSSTLAGNLVTIGSIANLIVIEQAKKCGVNIGFREHARVGVPVTVLTVAIAAAWMAWRG